MQLPSLWDYTIANTVIMTAEAYAIHAERFVANLNRVSDLTRHRIALGAFLTAENYIKAQKRGELFAKHLCIDESHSLDLLCYPGMMGDPPEIDKVGRYYYLDWPLITSPANLTGLQQLRWRGLFSCQYANVYSAYW